MFKSKIDIFIFGIKDDDTRTLFSIILNDYPIIILLLLIILFSVFCGYLNVKILKLNLKNISLKLPLAFVLNLALIYALIIGLRGPFRAVIMSNNTSSFSKLSVINDIAINPILAFSWALKAYKNEAKLPEFDKNKFEFLQNELFSLYQKSPKNEIAKKLKPHIFINLMESFGLNLMSLSNERLNLLGELDKHFRQDFLFTRFLSGGNATMPSFSRLFFGSPISNLPRSKFAKTRLKNSPFEPFKKAGYKLIFISSGNAAWLSIGEFLKTQGFEVLDENDLIAEFKGAKATHNGYGIADEFAYTKVYELLQNANEPLFIVHLSISNHAPFTKFGKNYLKSDEIPQDLLEKIYSPHTENKEKILQAAVYAANKFGEFMTHLKANKKLKNSVIVAMSGDHRQREFESNFLTQKAFDYSVPFYIYAPKALQNGLFYDKARIGSHKDIFPTLYALSLSEAEYISVGGKNMLAKLSDERLEFGFNELVFIDKSGVYPVNSNLGFEYENNFSLKNTNKSFERDTYHKNFEKFYKELEIYKLMLSLDL